MERRKHDLTNAEDKYILLQNNTERLHFKLSLLLKCGKSFFCLYVKWNDMNDTYVHTGRFAYL